jgi:hypothetical protein
MLFPPLSPIQVNFPKKILTNGTSTGDTFENKGQL